MGTVVVNLAVSIDGFIADLDDGCDEIFGWYSAGPVEVAIGAGQTMHMSEPSAEQLRRAVSNVGAFIVGRRLYDLTSGWDGTPPAEAPMVVLTHDPPEDWPRGGVDYHFVSEGIEAAVAKAQELAGDGEISVAGGRVARECLDAGLLDEVVINVVPVVLGEGIPFLAGIANGPVRFEDPEVIEAPGVTHMRYRVARDVGTE